MIAAKVTKEACSIILYVKTLKKIMNDSSSYWYIWYYEPNILFDKTQFVEINITYKKHKFEKNTKLAQIAFFSG